MAIFTDHSFLSKQLKAVRSPKTICRRHQNESELDTELNSEDAQSRWDTDTRYDSWNDPDPESFQKFWSNPFKKLRFASSLRRLGRKRKSEAKVEAADSPPWSAGDSSRDSLLWAKDILSPPERKAWGAPLVCLDEVEQSERFIFEGEVLDFLSRFLAERRRIDIPFSERHGLINFLENALEQCCFNWYKKWASEELDLAGIEAADYLDLEAWGYFIERLMERRRADPKIISAEAVTFDPADGLFYGAEDIRHDAVHRREYYSTLIRRAVRTACALRDRRLVSQIESVLRVLHYRHLESEKDAYMITPADEVIADSALQVMPTIVKTTHQLLVKLENLLENALFNFAKRHALSSIDWDIAEERELRDYDEQLRDYAARLGEKGVLLDDKNGSIFRDCLRSARELRNRTAHREHLTPRRCRQQIEVARKLAAIIQDDSLAATVEEVSASFMPLQDAVWACRGISSKTVEDCARTNSEEYHWTSTARGNCSKKMLAGFYYRANWTYRELADRQLSENLRQKSAWESFDEGVGSSLPAACFAEY
ncbi:MAG: hypothetical protein LQ342_005079 [Letrouitia transgressa]|nr:MAG: hypothetical protein LQ342_005079 [Letrouitia transgressa]